MDTECDPNFINKSILKDKKKINLNVNNDYLWVVG